MVSWSSTQVAAHNAKIFCGKHKPAANQPGDAARETGRDGLHEQIIRHCNAQRPRWKFRHAHTHCPTTEGLGVEDFTVFLPENITIHIECKSAKGKESPEQRVWSYEMDLLKHKVELVRSLKGFIEVCDKAMKAKDET